MRLDKHNSDYSGKYTRRHYATELQRFIDAVLASCNPLEKTDTLILMDYYIVPNQNYYISFRIILKGYKEG